MVLRTYEHEYPIISVVESNHTFDLYICRNISGGGLCRILCVKHKKMFTDIIGWVSENVNFNAFSDYIEHFNYDNMLCIVMRYTQGVTLKDKLATENLSFRERLELGRKILEKAVILELPDYFLDKCFSENNIIVAEDLSVNFNYPIEDIMYDRMCNAPEKIESILRFIFSKELEKRIPDELIAFFDKLPEYSVSGRIELYSEYHAMKNRVEEEDPDSQEPKTFWFLLWEKIKKLFGKLKIILTAGLIIGALIYLAIVFFGNDDFNKKDPHFDKIGIVDIDKSR